MKTSNDWESVLPRYQVTDRGLRRLTQVQITLQKMTSLISGGADNE